MAAYELTQQNVLTADPVNATFSVQTGEVRSRGFEVEGRASLGKQLDVVAAYARTNPKITKSNDVDLGRMLVSSPRYVASAFAQYRFGEGPLEGWGIGGGVRRVGSSFNVDNTIVVPPYTVFDLGLRYQRLLETPQSVGRIATYCWRSHIYFSWSCMVRHLSLHGPCPICYYFPAFKTHPGPREGLNPLASFAYQRLLCSRHCGSSALNARRCL